MSAPETITESEQTSTPAAQNNGGKGWLRRFFTTNSSTAPRTPAAEPALETQTAPEEKPLAGSDEPQEVVAPGGIHIRTLDDTAVHFGIGEMLPKVKDTMSLIPPFPQLLINLLKKIQNPLATATSVGNIAANDPALATSLIRTVNSAAFGLQRKI